MQMLKKFMSPYLGLRKEIYIIFLSRVINSLGALVHPLLALILTKKIGLSTAEAGLYVAVLGIMQMPASLIGGKLTDHFGRKRILLIFEALAAVFYGICIFVKPSMPLVFLLMLASICFGVAGPTHDAMTADLTTGEQRQGAFAMNYLGFNLGFAIAQLYVGFLFEDHFQWLFIIDAATAVLGLLLIGLFVGETMDMRHEEDRPMEAGELAIEEDRVKVSTFKLILSRKVLLYFAVAAFGYRFVYSQWSFMMPMHAEANFPGGGARLYGYMGSVNAAIVVICTPMLTYLFSKKTNIRRVIIAGIFFTLGFGLLGFISTKAAFFLSVTIFTVGEILEAISTTPFIMSHTPASHRGRMGSILSLMIGFGYTMGSLVMGNLLTVTTFEVGWLVAAGVVGISVVLMVFVERVEKRTS